MKRALAVIGIAALVAAACSGATEPDKLTSPVESGAILVDDLGCLVCHAGGSQLGPNLAGIWGEERINTAGATLIVDAAYIRESILFPERVEVTGFRGRMPGYIIDDAEIADIAAYVESLG